MKMSELREMLDDYEDDTEVRFVLRQHRTNLSYDVDTDYDGGDRLDLRLVDQQYHREPKEDGDDSE